MGDKLFADSEVFQKERPTKITDIQEQEFYKEFAQGIIDGKWSSDDLESIIQDVSDLSVHENGYELAKSLESYSCKASYDIDSEFVEYLDCFSHRKSGILTMNVRDWVKAHNPQPRFEIGQKLLIEKPLHQRVMRSGFIYVVGYFKDEAKYIVNVDPAKNGCGSLFTYEKVEVNCAKTA